VWEASEQPGFGLSPALAFLVLHLLSVEIHPSARRHGVHDADIAHAYDRVLVWVRLDEDPSRYLLAGPDRAGNLLELVVLDLEDGPLVIHAMALRPSTRRELFGDD
jgi:hypothetical protein